MKLKLPQVALLLLATGLALSAAPVKPTRPPNILLILADDLGWNEVGFNGSRYYLTPHLDQFAAESVRFTQAYTSSPVCSPTRSALMTGKNPARTHVTNFIPGNEYPYARLRQPDWQKFLPLQETTIAEVLSAGGYVTGLVGKWHLAKGYLPPESIEEGPDRQGFKETFITQKPDKKSDPEKDAHNVEKITRRAIQFLDDHRAEPFFLEVAHNSIHMEIMERAELVAKHRARPGSDRPENNPIIAAMMETLDNSTGRILAKLDELGLRENTIVIFYSDNGGLAANAKQTPFRGGKAEVYEGGIRVPLLVRWPGVTQAGRIEASPVITEDFFPTFLDMADLKPPAGLTLDGLDQVPLLRGGPAPARHALYWHYPHYHPAGRGPSGAIRLGDWKLVEYYERTVTGAGPEPELFDLSRDPGEKDNLAATHPAKVAELLADFRRWRERVGAQMPTANPNYDPAQAKDMGIGPH